MTEIGDSATRMDQLLTETRQFQRFCEKDIERAEELIATGTNLMNVRGACPSVQPKCDELFRVCEITNDRVTKRLEILTKARDLMERVEKVRKKFK
jgi:hypothetical protein